MKKITFGGVYVTDPVVPTFLDPKLTPWDQKCVTVEKPVVYTYTYSYTYSYSYTYTYTYAYIARRWGPGSWALARCVSSSC